MNSHALSVFLFFYCSANSIFWIMIGVVLLLVSSEFRTSFWTLTVMGCSG